MTLVNITMNNTLTYYGTLSIYGSNIPLAVSGVVNKVNAIMVSFMVGLAHGCQPILSLNMGVKNYKRVKAAFKRGLSVALVFSACVFLLFQLFSRQIIALFGTGESLYFDFGVRYLRIYMMMVFLFGIQPLSMTYFTSIGDVRRGIFLSLSRQGFLLISTLLMLPLFFGLDGFLFAGPIADFLSAMLALTLIHRNFKKLDQLARQQTTDPN